MARSTLAAIALLAAAATILVAPGANAGRLGVSRAGGSDANALFGRRLLDTCRTCSQMASCITATCVSATSTNVVVTVDFSGCKTGISWICCGLVPGSCSISSCDSNKISNGGLKCDDFTVLTMNFPITNGVVPATITIPQTCVAPTSCPASSVMTGAGIPNVDCSSCSAIATCFTESKAPNGFGPGTAKNFLDTSGCTYVKTDGTYTANVPGVGTLTFFNYPTTGGSGSTYPYLHQYFNADVATGTSVAVACYTDSSLTTVSKYIMVRRIDTASDNYDCLTCKWYNRFEITALPGSNCRCSSDTAWAFPIKSTLNAFTATQKTQMDNIVLGSPYPSNNVYWSTRQDTGNAWGGFFRFAPSSGKVSTTNVYNFDMCAGCAFNQIGDKGFIIGRLQFQFLTNNGSSSAMLFYTPSPGANVQSSVLQVYQSYMAPPVWSPGQFKAFDTTTNVNTPFGYGTTWKVLSVNTGPVTVPNTGTFNVPLTCSSGTTPVGVFLAVHMSVNGYFCDGTPPMN
ncbi:hypothetical protein HYH02_010702 [Chlamydomonas schloesseri]|uniref:Uncharacterized protein n=1 Tax=Chlamydomonas schloesseri TaxID=2026947 RepID=A0A835T4R2_9CHLO|nr:hypothetical protein HYH02_010702 [Chlamydomonas schloesseri]|eukprot:KAG2438907.1 hypothetical protein HYH02_010702 [Chlamydomonas schloesseri]